MTNSHGITVTIRGGEWPRSIGERVAKAAARAGIRGARSAEPLHGQPGRFEICGRAPGPDQPAPVLARVWVRIVGHHSRGD
jgi:hypothetical protein